MIGPNVPLIQAIIQQAINSGMSEDQALALFSSMTQEQVQTLIDTAISAIPAPVPDVDTYTSPNGNMWSLAVSNEGVLTAVSATFPPDPAQWTVLAGTPSEDSGIITLKAVGDGGPSTVYDIIESNDFHTLGSVSFKPDFSSGTNFQTMALRNSAGALVAGLGSWDDTHLQIIPGLGSSTALFTFDSSITHGIYDSFNYDPTAMAYWQFTNTDSTITVQYSSDGTTWLPFGTAPLSDTSVKFFVAAYLTPILLSNVVWS